MRESLLAHRPLWFLSILIQCALMPSPASGQSGQNPSTEQRQVLRFASFAYTCPKANSSDTESNSSTNNIYFFHKTLDLCLQSSLASVLDVEDVQSNFTGMVTCGLGACEVGTETIVDSFRLLGRLQLNVSFPPTPVPGPELLYPGMTVKCPFESDPPASVAFMKDTSADNNCSRSTVCRSCNATCNAVDPYSRRPSYLQQMCQSSTPCFVADSPTSVFILRNCYGCLTCSASNTINGVRYVETHRWMVDTTQDDRPACKAGIQDASLGLQPGTKFMPGRDTLVISVHFQSDIGYTYFWLVNGSQFVATDHNAQITEKTDAGCWQTVSVSWISAGPADGGLYEVILVAQNEETVRLNATIGALALPTAICDGSFCNDAGVCHKPTSSPEYCQCSPNHHGPNCQYSCQDIPERTTVTGFAVDLGCPVLTYLMCQADLATKDQNNVIWKRNGFPTGPRGMSYYLAIAQANVTDSASYSCFNGSKPLYTINMTVQSAPATDPIAVQKIDSRGPHNETWNFPVRFPIASFVSPAPTYSWTAVGRQLSTTEDAKRRDCVDSRRQYSQELILHNMRHCTGWYLGRATNTFGSVGFAVYCTADGPDPGLPVWEIIAISGGSGAFIMFIIMVLAFPVRWEWKKRQIKFGESDSRGHDLHHRTMPCPSCSGTGTIRQPVRNGNNFNDEDVALLDPSRSPQSSDPMDDDPILPVGGDQPPIQPDFASPVTPQRRVLSSAPEREDHGDGSFLVGEVHSADDDGSSLLATTPQHHSTPHQPLQYSRQPSPQGSSVCSAGGHDDTTRGSLVSSRSIDMGAERPGTTRLANEEVVNLLVNVDRMSPRQGVVEKFEGELKVCLAPLNEQLLHECSDCLSSEQSAQIVSVRKSPETRILLFLDCWREAEQKKFWDLFNAVCSVLGDQHSALVKRLRQDCELSLRSEYFKFGSPDAVGRDISTISQAFSHPEEGTPPFLSRSTRPSAVSSPLVQGGNLGNLAKDFAALATHYKGDLVDE